MSDDIVYRLKLRNSIIMGIQPDRDTNYSNPSWAPEPRPHKVVRQYELTDADWEEIRRKAKLTRWQKIKEAFKN